MKQIIRIIAVLALMLQFASNASATFFHVDVNTSSLIGNANAPFSLDFQLIGGSPSSNTATISNFTFGGGGSLAAPSLAGGATGSLAGTVTLDSGVAFFSEFYQGFTPGTTLGFDVSLTTNPNLPTPDGFSFSILDSSLFSIPTNGFGDTLVFVNIDGSNPSLQLGAGTGEFASVTVSAVPEPDTLLLLSLGLAVIGVAQRRKQA